MKKMIIITFVFILFLYIDAAYLKNKEKEYYDEEMRFIYISYLEYQENFLGNSVSINKSKIDKMIDNINYYKFNTIFLHVSPYSDAIYKSKYFPYSNTLTGVEGKNPGFDYLEYFLKKAHRKNIKVHAWINPYRISTKNDIESLFKTNPAFLWKNTENIGISNKGIYYDPSSEEVKELIIKQIEELIVNYNIDGIHLDDYFYVDHDLDEVEYNKYIEQNEEITLKEFRLMHTNDLIKRIGTLIKQKNDNILFSIAPDGNINNNYTYHYADVRTWINSNYIDIIMPQIYYGFKNQYLPFSKAYNLWYEMIKESNNNVKIIPVLAFYKVGVIDKGAGSGQNEWLEHGVIENQIHFLKERDEYEGFGLFRYDYLFNKKFSNSIIKKELSNIRKLV